MKYIKKVSVSPIPEINGSVVDTFNVEDKTTNAPSVNAVENYIKAQNTYSTEETFTGKYWIDGKKIYGKVIEQNIDSTSSGSGFTFIYLPSNIEKIFVKYAEVYISSTDNILILPYVFSDGKHLRINALTTSRISVENPTAYEGIGTFIIEYTKTTDV